MIDVKLNDRVYGVCEYLGMKIWGEAVSVNKHDNVVKIVERYTRHTYTLKLSEVTHAQPDYPTREVTICGELSDGV